MCGLSTAPHASSKLQTAQLLAAAAYDLYFSPPFSSMAAAQCKDSAAPLLLPLPSAPFTILSLEPFATSISHACLLSTGLVSSWSRTILAVDSISSPASSPLSNDPLCIARAVKSYLGSLLADLHVEPANTIVLIKRVQFRGPAGKVVLGALHASFIEQQLCALLAELPFARSLSSSKVCSYFSLPFGIVKNKACLDMIQSRTSETVTGRRSETLLNSYIINESLLTLSKGLCVSSSQEQEKIAFSLLQALAWLEWRNNVGAIITHLSTRL